jgi:hypothetical protein
MEYLPYPVRDMFYIFVVFCIINALIIDKCRNAKNIKMWKGVQNRHGDLSAPACDLQRDGALVRRNLICMGVMQGWRTRISI